MEMETTMRDLGSEGSYLIKIDSRGKKLKQFLGCGSAGSVGAENITVCVI